MRGIPRFTAGSWQRTQGTRLEEEAWIRKSQFQHEAERDGLVDAATTDERAEVVEVVEITTGAVGAKRKKATRIESLQNKVAAATEKIEKKQKKLVATAVSKQSLRAKEKESLQRWETELNNLFNERRAAQESLQVLLDAREQQDTTNEGGKGHRTTRAGREGERPAYVRGRGA
ncbi:hypothetical protein AB1Y20_010455 [Prymnesium parvum]|uniref:Uncharacterized protein n=1 Tax=Prymnesium parvum TaxID=97485 RepID=A0AB34IRF6_PRYPA